ncbi:MAG: SpoIIE family protein phosphatase [bacterium]|nr:SpoIIE family protein phosphatase [bacterium]
MAGTPPGAQEQPAAETGVTAEDQGSAQGNNRVSIMRNLTAYQMIFTTLPIAFAIIHLILFLYLRQSKENLYFAVFLLFYALNIFFDYQNSLYAVELRTLVLLSLNRVFLSIQWIFALRFIYSLYYKKLPRWFWYLSGLIIVGCIFTLINLADDNNVHYKYIVPVILLYEVEIARVIIKMVKEKRDGAWIVALGFSIFGFFGIFDTLIDKGIWDLFGEMENPYAMGTVGFLITMSFYLARNYSNTQQQLLEQESLAREKEMEHRFLEAENTRKSKELDEARQLQLSMLPQCVDPIPGLDVCFHMETATEVGGDYYDFQLEKDGTMVLTIGDATGHGTKAGIMVGAMKTLFHTIGNDPDIPAFFKRCTLTIKHMKMGNLFMALSVMRLKENKLTVASAGMPPLLIYREGRDQVEVIRIKSPPLGGFSDFNYEHQEVELMTGDVLLAMSDGLPELFNENGEMFGYGRTLEVFKNAPHDRARDVVSHLMELAETWRMEREQEDDITFVVVKIK